MEVEEFLSSLLQTNEDKDIKLRKSLLSCISIIESALEQYDIDKLALSFNGGKDACVTFHLLRYVLYKKYIDRPSSTDTLANIKIIYFYDEKEFPEITAFMQHLKTKYKFEYIVYSCTFKEGMQLSVKDGVTAVIMGLRCGDPYSEGVGYFEPSSQDWPAFMRIYPILHLEYHEIWSFLIGAALPYCCLYDEGYTSIGNIGNTIKNAALLYSDDDMISRYHPAYKLEDATLERVNRK